MAGQLVTITVGFSLDDRLQLPRLTDISLAPEFLRRNLSAMATRFGSVHAGSTVLDRAETCTCDKQTACVLGLCAARHLSLSVSCDSSSRSISTSNWHTDVLP